MIALAPALGLIFLSAVPQDESPRRRLILENGAIVLAERLPDAKSLSVQLFAGVRGVSETRETHGWRHLLEHLVLKGADGKLDDRMESQGVFFTGRTYRDAIQVEFTGRSDKLEPILNAIAEILQPLHTTPESIAREAAIMRHELAGVSDSARLSRTAWQAGFGDGGIDPLGDAQAIAKATPEALEQLRQRHFAPGNLVLVVSGAIEPEKTATLLRKRLETLEGPEDGARPERVGQPGRLEADDCFGEVRGGLVKNLRDAGAVLCAAYGVAARLDGAYVTYTPTDEAGLVIVGRTDANNTVGEFIDRLDEGEQAAIFPIGKLLAERWLAGQLATPAGSAFLRGYLQVQNAALRPEDLVDAVRKTGWPEFKVALARFQRANAVIAVGVRG